jgi:hypothetical protein
MNESFTTSLIAESGGGLGQEAGATFFGPPQPVMQSSNSALCLKTVAPATLACKHEFLQNAGTKCPYDFPRCQGIDRRPERWRQVKQLRAASQSSVVQ